MRIIFVSFLLLLRVEFVTDRNHFYLLICLSSYLTYMYVCFCLNSFCAKCIKYSFVLCLKNASIVDIKSANNSHGEIDYTIIIIYASDIQLFFITSFFPISPNALSLLWLRITKNSTSILKKGNKINKMFINIKGVDLVTFPFSLLGVSFRVQ